ncbi:hypothetical protein C922_01378 [Plasmodium inui San Antonio 1]|uniref:Uncharacterized protein n=1 Tax=Plasmodium inui San Antonio 1 TaxID=1237626 RepID=W7AAP8_9APIC|nr:hypothetical protein C922_01378 [Plasmodium inui San Antonio 1]EUD68358.1 hypothetical protein C922_01378 [Plasmodium inui San Antonio 1]
MHDSPSQRITLLITFLLANFNFLPPSPFNPFSCVQINQWSNVICETSMDFLYSKLLPAKYIISCYILKSANTEAALRFSTYWDTGDKHLQICWPEDQKNSNMRCYVNVYVLKIAHEE